MSFSLVRQDHSCHEIAIIPSKINNPIKNTKRRTSFETDNKKFDVLVLFV